jgi:hypothetical protein
MGTEQFLMGKAELLERDANLQHLQAELVRLDQRLARAVRRWKQAGQDSEDVFRGLYISDAQAEALRHRPLAVSWGQSVELPAEEEQAFLKAEAAAQQHIPPGSPGGEKCHSAPCAAKLRFWPESF